MPYLTLNDAVPVALTLMLAALPAAVMAAQGREEAADRAQLLALNLDYVRAVQAATSPGSRPSSPTTSAPRCPTDRCSTKRRSSPRPPSR